MPADAFIQCRVTPEMKELVRELARRERISESALVKQLLDVLVRTSASPPHPTVERSDQANRDARLCVRLDPDDRKMLADRAAARGMRSATYVSVLVRSHLRGVAPLPKDELLALKRAIAELTAIGRNLNQIAKASHQGTALSQGREDLRAMLKIAEALRDHFRELLKANERSWSGGLPCNG
jgi:Bacterial mobilisation protein (MobC)